MVDWYGGRWPGRTEGVPPRDVGGATAIGITRFKTSGDVTNCGAGEGRAGNGSLMRCIPTGLFVKKERLLSESMAISAVTHDDAHAKIACAAYNAMVRALVEGKGVEEAVKEAKEVVELCVEERGGARVGLASKRVESAIDDGVELVKLRELTENGPEDAENAAKVIPFGGAGYVLESLTIAVAALVDKRLLEDVLVDVARLGRIWIRMRR